MSEAAWALIVGVALGAWWGGFWVFMCIGAAATGAYAWRRQHATVLVAIAALGAAWYVVRHDHTSTDHVSHVIGPTSRLARVEGVIDSDPTYSSPWRGALGAFHYPRQPNTLAVLRVLRLDGAPASGLLLLRVREADDALQRGLRIEATGWLSPVRGPGNPGEFDYRRHLADRGIVGQLSLATSGNWRPSGEPRPAPPGLRQRLGDAAEGALNLGLSDDPVRLALLQTMLLGRWSGDLAGVDDAFREVGLAHLLSISGAHLGILLGLVWLGCRLLLIRPSRSALVVLTVLMLFLLAVPPRVPIVRAGIMAAVLGVTVWAGRRIDARQSLALAAVIVLLWRPGDLFSPGFQLSFLVVAALLAFTERWLEIIWPTAWIAVDRPTLAARVGRWTVGYAVAGTIAFAVALPVVAYHYRLISPLAVGLSLLALPVLTAVLGLGYAKVLLGLVSPSASLILAGPLRWVSDALLDLVREAQSWPGATVRLSGEPNAAWSTGWLVLIWALLAGRFAGRRRALVLACALMVGWTASMNLPLGRPAAQVVALAVGDGSCLLVRTAEQTLLFDCGSQRYMDVGPRSVSPALQALGVRRIDTLVISHSDMDHYGGMLDVADATPVRRAWISPQLIAEARRKPDGPVAYLLEGLRDRGVHVEPVARGHMEGAVRVLWPPTEYAPPTANDASIVLRIEAAGRTVLLTGDIQQEAITALLASGEDLRADVAELPHHGSIVRATGDWLDAVQPRIVLQSCGPMRTRDEQWDALLAGRSVQRHVTAHEGMIRVAIGRDGTLTVDTFRADSYDASEE